MAAQADPQKPSAERETYKELIAIKKNTQFTEENQLSGERNESIGGENKKEEGPLSKKGEGAKISQSFPPITSLILSFIIVLILAFPVFFTSHGEIFTAKLLWIGFIGFASYRVFKTGRVSKWRSIFFVLLAFSFLLQFKASLIGLKGSAWVTDKIQEVPYCHIALSANFLNTLYSQFMALNSSDYLKWAPLTAGVFFWLLATLSIGQGWCSWACFYGGLDTAFSKLKKKPFLKLFYLPTGTGLRDFSLALLVSMLLLSLWQLRPIYCLWVCPLKITTGFLDPVDIIRKIQLAIFATVGIVFIIILPLLINKRTFCSFLCPFGAWQAIAGRVSPFRVTIDPNICTLCQQCMKVCPMYAIDEQGVKEHKVSSYCNRCGDCFDACPTGAIDYSILGKKQAGVNPRILFLISAWLVGGSVSLLFVPQAGLRIFHSILLIWRG